jgi:hypothetical protein
MKKKLFENIGDNMFKLRKNLNESVFDTTLTITNPETDVEEDVDVTVTYTYYPSSRGARERGTGLQLEPDEEATIDIESVKDSTGKEIDLSDSDLEQLQNDIFDRVADSYNDQDEYEPDQYDEAKGNGYNGYRITSKEKKLIAKNLEVFPELKGLKKLESFKSALGLISKSLDAAGFELDMVTGDILLGQKGTRLLTFSKSEVESFGRKMPSESVVNSRINFTWENLSGDQFNPRYEVIAYVS